MIYKFSVAVFLLALGTVAYGQELSLEEIARQKAETQKDFQIGKLMQENASMKFEKLLQIEEAVKQKQLNDSKAKEKK